MSDAVPAFAMNNCMRALCLLRLAGPPPPARLATLVFLTFTTPPCPALPPSLKAFLPVMESFGFETDLRYHTQVRVGALLCIGLCCMYALAGASVLTRRVASHLLRRLPGRWSILSPVLQALLHFASLPPLPFLPPNRARPSACRCSTTGRLCRETRWTDRWCCARWSPRPCRQVSSVNLFASNEC